MAANTVVLQIRIDDPELVDSIEQGKLNDVDRQISLSFGQQISKEAATGLEPLLLTVIVSFATSVPAGFLANWLYDKFKSKASEMRIDSERVEIEVKSITEKITIYCDRNGGS